jgi:hypothetical protein
MVSTMTATYRYTWLFNHTPQAACSWWVWRTIRRGYPSTGLDLHGGAFSCVEPAGRLRLAVLARPCVCARNVLTSV